jgi:hypothetical protein
VQAVEDVGMLPLRGAVSSREQPEPTPANTPPVLTLEDLQRKVAMIPGVASADGLGFVDLPSGSLAMGTSRIRRPIRVFAFDRSYQARYPSIRIVAGGFRPASALLSAGRPEHSQRSPVPRSICASPVAARHSPCR